MKVDENCGWKRASGLKQCEVANYSFLGQLSSLFSSHFSLLKSMKVETRQWDRAVCPSEVFRGRKSWAREQGHGARPATDNNDNFQDWSVIASLQISFALCPPSLCGQLKKERNTRGNRIRGNEAVCWHKGCPHGRALLIGELLFA